MENEDCKLELQNGFSKESQITFECHPDLAVVQECEYLGEETTKKIWFGDNRKKGIGIFPYSDYELELHKEYNPSFNYVIPIKVKGHLKFNLFAIWAMNDLQDVRKRYIGQVYSAIMHYKALLDEPIVIIGDFNWNVIWDAKPDYPLYGTFTDVIRILESNKIRSVYHEFYKEYFGKETRPTLFMYHRKNRLYHVNYCFASTDFEVNNVEVGDFDDWIGKSDHMPIIVAFDEDEKEANKYL